MRSWIQLFLLTITWVFTASLAYADPIDAIIAVAAIIGTIAGSTTLAVVAATVIVAGLEIGISIGLSYVINSLFGTTPKNTVNGTNGTIKTGGTNSRSFLVGLYATAGSAVYFGSWGTDGDVPNAYLVYVIALSDLPMHALTGIYIQEARCAYNTGNTPVLQGYPVTEYRVGSKDYMWVKFYDGTQTGPSTYLTGKFGADPNYPYTPDMIGTGVAYVVMTMLYNPKLFQGFPSFKFEGQGAHLYDRRKDGSDGGTGSHRYGTYSTYEYTLNPITVINNILRGIQYNGVWLWGLQTLSSPRVPSASWFAAANVCDTDVNDSDGNPQDQYRCGGEITVDMQPADVIESFLMTCNGRFAEIGGVYKVTAGAAGSSVFSFTDDDLIISQAQSYRPEVPLEQLINGASATYPEKTQSWTTTDAPDVTYPDLEDEDGGQYLANLNFGACPYFEQVERLMVSAVNEHRNFRSHTLVGPPIFWIFEPLDIVDWTSTRNGYVAKNFRIDGASDTPNLDIPIAINEIDDTDYDFNTATDYVVPVFQTIVVVAAPDPLPAVGDFVVYKMGSFLIASFTPLNNPRVQGYTLTYGPSGAVLTDSSLIAYPVSSNYSFPIFVNGSYRFFLYAVDELGQAGTEAQSDLTIGSGGAAGFTEINHTFSSPGTYSEQVPSNAAFIDITDDGPGAGGSCGGPGSDGTGGGGGGRSFRTYPIVSGDWGNTLTLTVGAGGPGCSDIDGGFGDIGDASSTVTGSITAGTISMTANTGAANGTGGSATGNTSGSTSNTDTTGGTNSGHTGGVAPGDSPGDGGNGGLSGAYGANGGNGRIKVRWY